MSVKFGGNHSVNGAENVHLEYLKPVLGVRKNTNNAMVYVETDRLPLNVVRWFRIFNFGLKYYQAKIVF
jgi:hypothetical protein